MSSTFSQTIQSITMPISIRRKSFRGGFEAERIAMSIYLSKGERGLTMGINQDQQ